MPNFGASFKKARESKGIPLDRIATETRISTRFLQAIENEDFHLLPGGIFNRGFIRTYAERLGLDPEQAVAEYEQLAEVRAPSEPVVAHQYAGTKGQSAIVSCGDWRADPGDCHFLHRYAGFRKYDRNGQSTPSPNFATRNARYAARHSSATCHRAARSCDSAPTVGFGAAPSNRTPYSGAVNGRPYSRDGSERAPRGSKSRRTASQS